MSDDTKSHSLQIERLMRGGYVVLEPSRLNMGLPPAFLAGFSDIRDALHFIEGQMMPNAAESLRDIGDDLLRGKLT